MNASRATAAITIEELMAVVEITKLAVSPDERHVALVTRRADWKRNAYDCSLYVVDLVGDAAPRRLGTVSSNAGLRSGFVDRALEWADDSKSVFYLTQHEGRLQVYEWPIKGGQPRQITNHPDGVATFSVERGARAIDYVVPRVRGTSEEIAGIEHKAVTDGMLYAPPVGWGDYWQAEGISRQVRRNLGFDLVQRRIDLATLQESERPLGQSNLERIDTDLLRWFAGTHRVDLILGERQHTVPSPDGRCKASVQRVYREGRRVYTLLCEDAMGTKTDLYSSARPISLLGWRHDSSAVYFQQFDGLRSRVLSVPVSGRLAPVKVFESDSLMENAWLDGRAKRVVYLESSATQPRRLVVTELPSRATRILLDPNADLVERIGTTPVHVRIGSQYGIETFGYLVLPPHRRQGERYPLVIVTYRASGFLKGGSNDEYPVYPLAAAGFAVFVLDAGSNAILSVEHGDPFKMFGRYWSYSDTIAQTLETLSRMDAVDLSRKALTGFSYSADTGWVHLTRGHEFDTAIFSDTGINSWYFDYMGSLRPDTCQVFDCVFRRPPLTTEDERAWEEVDVYRRSRHIRAPILLNESDNEFALNLGVVNALERMGKPHELHIYPGAGHIINQPAQRYSIYHRNLDWLRFWLMNKEDSTPEKAGQYRRWHLLKQQHEWNERLWARGQDPAAEFARQRRAPVLRESVDGEWTAPMLRARTSGR